jgi:hypothetical protein
MSNSRRVIAFSKASSPGRPSRPLAPDIPIRERVMAGLARAREEGIKLGRRPIEEADAKKAAAIRTYYSSVVQARRLQTADAAAVHERVQKTPRYSSAENPALPPF